MKNKLVFYMLLIVAFGFNGCDDADDIKQPKACFDYFPLTDIKVGDDVVFINCSTDAESYIWNFNDGTAESYAENPIHSFNETGTYNVRLTVQNKSKNEHIDKTITITDETEIINPKDYNGVPDWETLYFVDFSATTEDWLQGSGSTWSATIYDGYYTIKDTDASETNYGRYYSTDATKIPGNNYDIEARIKNTIDNGNYGSGLIYGLNPTAQTFNYFKFSIGLYTIGDTDGIWQDWKETLYGATQDWNKLTVRKYGNKYYYFINEQFIYEYNYSSFGSNLGFLIDKDTHVDIDWVGLYSMKFTSAKSTGMKQQINIGTNQGKGEGIKVTTPLNRK